MRRKSERNKAKGSPEKKIEKPTRKSTRRRGKRSPSTSPERDNSSDATAASSAVLLSTVDESEAETAPSQICDSEKINETSESNVTSTEAPSMIHQPQQQQPQQSVQPEDDEESVTAAGCVWKVARADASPGEIQKLKLCRQRNMSETSDASSSRKKSNKWQDGGGEGTTEEIDSGDERTTIISSKTIVDSGNTTEEITSVLRGRESPSEEVSDSKEFPPVIAKAELSDVEPNIDEELHTETSEMEIAIETIVPIDKDARETLPSGRIITTIGIVDANGDNMNKDNVTKDEEPKKLMKSKDNNDVNVDNAKETISVDIKYDSDNDDHKETIKNKDSSSDDNDDKEREEETANTKITANRKISSEDNRKISSEDNSDADKDVKSSKKRLSRIANRRKHRDKYRDSSNSESGESEDDNERDNARDKRNLKVKETQEAPEIIKDTKDAENISHTPENRPETPIAHDIPVVTEDKIVADITTKSNYENEALDQIAVLTTKLAQSQTNYKPAKVNLKRSFSARPSLETIESKKIVTENDINDLANQDKENHVSSDQTDSKFILKKRRWGTILFSSDAAPAFSVSTDSLKVLVPGAKPLPINEVRLTKDDDEDRDRRNQREKRYSTGESVEHKMLRDDVEKLKNAETKKDAKGDNHIASRRKISIVKDTPHMKSPSPPAAVATNILLIKNLVRPFTLNQIRELLSRTGVIVENGFWMDRIKSKCFVEYSNEDQAFETRQALHGISWPVSNPKRLQVEYATKEDLELARELSKDQPTSRKTELIAANDGWQHDWARDERTNSMGKVTVVREWDLGKEDGQHFAKDKEREKKELEKKRRQRSRTPALEAHLPAPARKFKKKEDDPPPAKLLDDLFRKTKATPCIYWLPLTNEQIVVKEEMRRQHMAEHARRLEEMRRAERNRDGRRRRSPRK